MTSQVLLNPQTAELSKKDFLKIPTTLKNKVLMAPGPWNGVHYTGEEISNAYENTDWKNKDVISLILDHADKPLSVHDWVGWIKNPKMIGGNLLGDLEIYDEDILVKLLTAKMKCGISPRVKGMEHDGEFRNFTFENFSVVSNPAVKKAFINLTQNKINKGGKMTEKELQEESVEEVKEEEESSEEKAPEEESKEEVKEMAKKKLVNKKKKYPYPAEEEMNDEDLLEVVTNSAWTDFVSKMRKEYPKMSFKAIAAAFKKTKKASDELEELSDEELVDKIEEFTSVLQRRKKYKEPEEEKMNDVEKKMSQEIKELREKLDEPDSKTVQELSNKDKSIYSSDKQHHTGGTLEMANFLQNLAK